MTRERFIRVVSEVMDSLPRKYRERVRNVAVLVEDYPPHQREACRRMRPRRMGARPLTMGVYIGTPSTQKSVFDLPSGPDHIILYQKNIEKACRNEREVREQIMFTVMHELGHYFGLSEDELEDV